MPDMRQDHIAFDRSPSNRWVDEDGHLHVRLSHISKANVCPYYGREIPRAAELGLKPDTVYQLLRDPDELAKAAPTFNGKPLLTVHKQQSAEDHDHELTVGSVNNSTFNAPYLDAELVVWDAAAIAGIETGDQRQLSSSYRYDADMTPGEYDGVRYDGRMVNIRCNHVALVPVGRAGSDVVVGDAAPQPPITTPKEIAPMAAKTHALSRKALLASGALRAYLKPKLAADAAIDIPSVLKDVTAKNFRAQKPKIKVALDAALKGKLAQDADIEDVVELLDTLDEVTDEVADVVAEKAADPEVKPAATDDDGDKVARLREVLKAKGMSDEDIDAVIAALDNDEPVVPPAMDTTKPAPITKAAMDAAITAAATAAEKRAVARLNGVREAEKAVAPYVGELAIAMDSADGVFKTALEMLGVDIAGVHPSAYPAILRVQPKPGEQKRTAAPARVAMDAATAADYAKRFPHANRLAR